MKKFVAAFTLRKFLFGFVISGLFAAVVTVPFPFRSQAGGQKDGENVLQRTESREKGLNNYDIRSDKSEAETLIKFRQAEGKNAVESADARDKFVAGENALRRRVPNLTVQYNNDIRTPEIIAPDVKQGRAFLSPASEIKRPEVLRNFIKQNNDLLGISDEQSNQLKLIADYTNPDGNLSFAQFDQKINGIPIFRGEVKAAFAKNGAIIRVVNNLAPEMDYANVPTDFRDPLDAVKFAARYINHELNASDLTSKKEASNDLKTTFGEGDWATTAEKIYFPTEPGVARAAWRVLIWQPVNAYYIIVDAETGKMLWRKNITADQTQTATFNVYANTTSIIQTLHSSAPLSPGPIDPSIGTQGLSQARTNVTLVGNEAPYNFNNKGWITDGNNTTDGNNVEAGVDRVAPNGVDAAVAGNNRIFEFNYNPAPGNPSPGDNPLDAEFQKGATTQMFYLLNRYHDELYLLGFNEQAHNFQHDNFGRGGNGNDRVSAEGQDVSGTNNANFSSPADGGRGRMQMFLWSAPNPDYDGTIDSDIVIHELTHGTSNRLHGNGSGLGGNMADGMGEGWSDFYAHALLSEPTDPIEGIYTIGGYTTYLLSGTSYAKNYYYGIRRFPKAVKSFVGPNGKPHNPLSFRHLNSNCNEEIGSPSSIGSISAFPRGPVGSTTCDQVHTAGEIWSTALWEVRGKLVSRLGWEVGNRRALQYVTDGMKLAPLNPTFLQERDAIIAAALASGNDDDVADIWAGFAIRGMGFSAAIISTSPANVVEAFDLPNVIQMPNFTLQEIDGNNNNYADPGETLHLSIPLSNNTGKTAFGTTLQIEGGGNANYGDIASGQTVTRTINFTVPAGAPCGSKLTVKLIINNSLGSRTETRNLLIGLPVVGAVQNFDGVTAPAIPDDWTAFAPNPSTGSTAPWQTTTASSTAPNSIFAPAPSKVYLAQIESPSFAINAAAAKLKFKINYNTESGWDGTTLDIKIGAGEYKDIVEAGGTFVSGGYSASLGSGNFPNSGRSAWTGDSNGFINVEIILPASANGQNVRFRWSASADTSVDGIGTYIDDIEVISSYVCSGVSSSAKSRADFDGDGKTDMSVFRPSTGNWFMNQTSFGFNAMLWGISSDRLVPGDFDGDAKTDTAVARTNESNTAVNFFILNSANGSVTSVQWGLPTDIPVIGDYDGDGKDDIAVWRASDGVWYINKSSGGFFAFQFGANGDVPVPADYDGDGKTDHAVFRNGLWVINKSNGGIQYLTFGFNTDKLVPADYDGDGKDDIAVYRPSDGVWYINKSDGGGLQSTHFGNSTDIPVPGDYDGDGKDDIAVYRNGTWYLNRSTSGFAAENFGAPSDLPIPKQYIP